jgi:hypothetical protein
MITHYLSGASGSNYTFRGSQQHGDVIVDGNDWEPEIVEEKFFGVQGVSHLIGAPGGRDLSCEFWLTGYVSAIALGNDLQEIDSKIGLLLGSVAITGNITGSYNNCTFLGYRRGARFYDGSGLNGWMIQGQLIWRQRKP